MARLNIAENNLFCIFTSSFVPFVSLFPCLLSPSTAVLFLRWHSFQYNAINDEIRVDCIYVRYGARTT
jgi:hypothetical protein